MKFNKKYDPKKIKIINKVKTYQFWYKERHYTYIYESSSSIGQSFIKSGTNIIYSSHNPNLNTTEGEDVYNAFIEQEIKK